MIRGAIEQVESCSGACMVYGRTLNDSVEASIICIPDIRKTDV